MEYEISLCAAAIRPVLWQAMVNSLSQNKCRWQLLLVGPLAPLHPLPSNVRWIESNVKPAQRQEISVRMAKSEFIGITVDDADYNSDRAKCPNSLDIMLNALRESDQKTIMAMSIIEEVNGSIRHEDENHRFVWADKNTPQVMLLPYCRRQSWLDLGGIDKAFWGGLWECDFTLNALEAGYKTKVVKEARMVMHNNDTRRIPTPGGRIDGHTNGEAFNFLQRTWVRNSVVQSKRQNPIRPFDDKDILIVEQI